MKVFIKKFAIRITALCFLCGAVFLCSGFGRTLPDGVYVNGVYVGGMTRPLAAEKLRGDINKKLKDKTLTVHAGENAYAYSAPEIGYTDCFGDMLGKINKKGEYFCPVKYHLCGLKEIVSYISSAAEKVKTEPYCEFTPDISPDEPFAYFAGCDGIACDRKKLESDIARSLGGDFGDVYAALKTEKRVGTMEDVKRRTELLCSFTTYFDGANTNRVKNIRLAAGKINGLILAPGEMFSFNKTVGERTEKNGFLRAKIISGGKYVEDFGGGVCQVSGTLYNAAALSGLKICEYHAHSLAVSYLPPSRDAMVSGNYFDLKFKNVRSTPVYVSAIVSADYVTCRFYGESDGYEYTFSSEIMEPKDGETGNVLCSAGALVREKDGVKETVFVRTDGYSVLGNTD